MEEREETEFCGMDLVTERGSGGGISLYSKLMESFDAMFDLKQQK